MKIRLSLLALAMVCFGVTAMAQDAPKGDVFAGFSVLSVSDLTAYGWQGSGAYNASRNIGLVADFGGQYKDSVDQHQFLFGPRYNARMEKVNPFAHALFGFARVSAGNFSDTNFAMGFGGGLDVKAGAKLNIRVIQFDWLPIKSAGDWTTDAFRFGFGVVFPLGQ